MHEDKRAETPLAMHFWASGLLQQDPDAAIVAEKNQVGRTRTRLIAEGVAQGAWANLRSQAPLRETQIKKNFGDESGFYPWPQVQRRNCSILAQS